MDYTEPSAYDGPWYRPYSDRLICRTTSRTYANGDKVRLFNVGMGVKFGDGLALNDELDTNAAPTMTGVIRVTNGTTTKKLISITAATLGTAGGATRVNEIEGLGFVTPALGYWVEFVVTGAVATAGAGILAVDLGVTGLCFKGEDPTRPTG